jgi:hypothetical protein
VRREVAAASLGCLYTLNSCVGVDVKLASGNNGVDILGSLLYIALDIHGETRCFRDGETEVESNNTRNTAKTDENTPAVVHMSEVIERVVNDLMLEPLHYTERNDSSS